MPSQFDIVDLPGGGGKETKESADAKIRKPRASAAKKTASESDLKGRLTTVFGKIADAAEARGDDELATTLREDMEVMATGIVSFTRPFLALRTPIVLLLAIVEPIMAFWKIGILMIGRVMLRRRRPQEESPGDRTD